MLAISEIDMKERYLALSNLDVASLDGRGHNLAHTHSVSQIVVSADTEADSCCA
jgi:hypothetical protein